MSIDTIQGVLTDTKVLATSMLGTLFLVPILILDRHKLESSLTQAKDNSM